MVVFDTATDFCQLFTIVIYRLSRQLGLSANAISVSVERDKGIDTDDIKLKKLRAYPMFSRATLRVSRDPELPAATKTIQREPETNQHWSNVPIIHKM
jgi:hypothetical protein